MGMYAHENGYYAPFVSKSGVDRMREVVGLGAVTLVSIVRGA